MSDEADFEAPRAQATRAGPVERAAWGLLLLACTAPLQTLLDAGGRPGTVLLTAVAATGAAAALMTRGGFAAAFTLGRTTWPLLLMIVLMGVFALGAVDPHWSGVRWVTWLPCVVAAFCAAARLGSGDFATVALSLLATAMIGSVGVALAWPSLAATAAPATGEDGGGAWSGLYPTKNALGHVAGVAFALLLTLGRPSLGWITTVVGAAAATACLIMARSASGLVIALLLTAFVLLILKGSRWMRWFALLGLAVAVVAFALDGEAWLKAAAGTVGRDASLTGRTAIWREAWPLATQHPLIGSGYDYAGSPDITARLRGLFGVYSVHSGYLNALISFGFGLCVFFAVVVAGALGGAWRGRQGQERRDVATALLVGGLLSAVTETGITHPSGPMQMLWWLALFGLCARA